MYTSPNAKEYTIKDILNDGQKIHDKINYFIEDTDLKEIMDTIQEISHKNKKTEIKPIEIFLKIYSKPTHTEPLARNYHEEQFFEKYSRKEPYLITDIDRMLDEYKKSGFNTHMTFLEKTGALTKKNNEYIINHEMLETLQYIHNITVNNQDPPSDKNTKLNQDTKEI